MGRRYVWRHRPETVRSLNFGPRQSRLARELGARPHAGLPERLAQVGLDVRLLTNSAAATSLFVRPAATSSATRRSVAVEVQGRPSAGH